MKRFAALLLILLLAIPSFADELWLGVYLKGQKIGYTGYLSEEKQVAGRKIFLRTTKTKISGTMLGQGLEMNLESTTWYTQAGKVARMLFNLESGGRKIKTDAEFGEKVIKARLDADGNVSEKTIDVPTDGIISDDPVADYLLGGTSLKKVYVFDPQTLSLIPNTIQPAVTSQIEEGGRSLTVRTIKIDDPRAPTTLYFSSKGDLIRADGPFGLEMVPELKELALKIDGSPRRPSTGSSDLATASSIVPDRRIHDPYSGSSLELLLTDSDFSHLPSDEHQTVTKLPTGYRVVIHPVLKPNATTTISEAAASMPEWILPDVRVPSNKPLFAREARKVIGKEQRVAAATEMIRDYVNGLLRVNAGIGVMRDATEILGSPEGVCRDHAILMAALLRAVHIPTRLVGGLVYAEGAFYYHAWVEVWDGSRWYGVDSTRPDKRVTAAHFKTAQGSVSEAYTAFMLSGAKIKIVSTQESQ